MFAFMNNFIYQNGGSANNRQTTATANSVSEHNHGADQISPACECSVCSIKIMPLLLSSSASLFTAHEHPKLKVPVCGLCSQRALGVEMAILAKDKLISTAASTDDSQDCRGDGQSDEEDGACSWCCRPETDDAVFLLCDGCPRMFCRECCEKAYGCNGELSAISMVDKLCSSDVEWRCFCCQNPPTMVIDQLRESLIEIQRKEDLTEEETAVILVEKLTNIEDEKVEATNALDQAQIDVERVNIRQELVNDKKISPDDIDSAIEEEIELYVQSWSDHFDRLDSDIPLIQEALNGVGVSSKRFYEERDKHIPPSKDHAEKQEKARKAAEEELNRRGPSERFEYENENEMVYELDIEDIDADSIIEINDDEAALDTSMNASLKKGRHKSSEMFTRVYKRAIEFEDRILSNKKPKKKLEALDKKCEGEFKKCKGFFSEDKATIRYIARDRKKMTLKRKKKSTDNSIVGTIGPAPTKEKKRAELSTIKPIPLRPFSRPLSPPLQHDNSISYQHSDLLLNPNEKENPISVVQQLASVLKPHQIEGVQFMFQNVCQSFESLQSPDLKNVRGCVLAHNMGLGKSLQVIALIHTLFSNPVLVKRPTGKRLFRSVLICVPVNTLANWKDEFDLWVNSKHNLPQLSVYFLKKNSSAYDRSRTVCRWKRDGGILILTTSTFATICNKTTKSTVSGNTHSENFEEDTRVALLSPDLVVIDEAHTALTNDKTSRFKAFSAMSTKRRIALTGTPVQNNLLEYYQMISWIRPYSFESKKIFQSKFVDPIVDGSAADSSEKAKASQRLATRELHLILDKFVHRRSSDLLAKDLPPMQQAVIVVRASRIQNKLQKKCPHGKFLEWYSAMRPVFNHPACLSNIGAGASPSLHSISSKITSDESKRDTPSPTPIESALKANGKKWWEGVYEKYSNINNISNGGKMVILMQIIMHADLLDEKVVVFSQCLKSLDFVERILNEEDWGASISSLKNLSPGKVWGAWRRNRDYLRIDGSNSASQRGDMINSFKDTDDFKVFLISTKAGGIGINLTSANRVVLLDSGFNPSIEQQAVYRCYRYGQKKPVYVHRLLTEGTEEKVYKRQVTKLGLAARVIDKEYLERNFTNAELSQIKIVSNWVQCDACNKWRMLPPEADDVDEDKNWECRDNIYDPPRSKCDAPERDEQWYMKYKKQRDPNWLGETLIQNARAIETKNVEDKLRRNDIILDKVITEMEGLYLSRYFFHESLLGEAEPDAEEAVDILPEETLEQPVLVIDENAARRNNHVKEKTHGDNVALDRPNQTQNVDIEMEHFLSKEYSAVLKTNTSVTNIEDRMTAFLTREHALCVSDEIARKAKTSSNVPLHRSNSITSTDNAREQISAKSAKVVRHSNSKSGSPKLAKENEQPNFVELTSSKMQPNMSAQAKVGKSSQNVFSLTSSKAKSHTERSLNEKSHESSCSASGTGAKPLVVGGESNQTRPPSTLLTSSPRESKTTENAKGGPTVDQLVVRDKSPAQKADIASKAKDVMDPSSDSGSQKKTSQGFVAKKCRAIKIGNTAPLPSVADGRKAEPSSSSREFKPVEFYFSDTSLDQAVIGEHSPPQRGDEFAAGSKGVVAISKGSRSLKIEPNECSAKKSDALSWTAAGRKKHNFIRRTGLVLKAQGRKGVIVPPKPSPKKRIIIELLSDSDDDDESFNEQPSSKKSLNETLNDESSSDNPPPSHPSDSLSEAQDEHSLSDEDDGDEDVSAKPKVSASIKSLSVFL